MCPVPRVQARLGGPAASGAFLIAPGALIAGLDGLPLSSLGVGRRGRLDADGAVWLVEHQPDGFLLTHGPRAVISARRPRIDR